MSDEALNFRITAQDLASAKFANVNREVTSLGSKIKGSILTGVGLGAGISAFNLLGDAVHETVGFISDSIKAAETQQSSMAALTSVLKANDATWRGNSDAIEAVIKSREALGYTDNEQRASLGVLVAMTKDHTSALAIERVAMDVVAVTGRSFADVNLALGKAFEGNTTSLKKLGIAVKAGTSGYDLLNIVQTRYAGAAEASSKTTAGAAKVLAAEMEALQEKIGIALLPVVRDLLKLVAALLPVFEDAAGAIGKVVEVIKDLTPGLVVLSGVLLITAIPAIIATGVAIAGAALAAAPFIVAATAIAAAVGLFSVAVKQANFDTGKFEGRVKDASGHVATAASAMTTSFTHLAGTVSRNLGPRGTMPKAVEDGTAAAVARMAAMPGEMADAMLSNQQKLANAATQLLAFMKAALSPAQVIARDKGFLASKELAAGLASNNPLVKKKAQELRDAALAELNMENQARIWGYHGADSWWGGFNSAWDYSQSLFSGKIALLEQKLQFAGSPPYTHAIEAGAGVASHYMKALMKGIGSFGGMKLPSLPTLGPPGGMALGVPMRLAPAMASGSGRAPVTIQATYAPMFSTLTPAEGQKAARALVPELMRELRRQGFMM
jgi:hypothetical protein